MIEDFGLYGLLVFLNIMDIGFSYIFIYNLVTPRSDLLGKRREIAPPLSIKIVSRGIVYSAIVGYLGYFFGSDPILRATGVIIMIGFIKFFTKDNLRNAIILYILTFLTGMAIQVLWGPLLDWLGIPQIFNVLISMFLAGGICCLICLKINVHKIFIFIKHSFQRLRTTTLGGVTVVASVLVFYFFWQEYYARWGLFFIIALLVAIAYPLVLYIMRLQLRIHNMNNLLEGIEYLLKTENNNEEIYVHYNQTLKNNGFEISDYKVYQSGEYKENLIRFIQSKKTQYNSKAALNMDIKFFYHHHRVPTPMVIQILGILLDNTFETKPKKPVFIEVFVAASQLSIRIANASDNKSPAEIDEMFSEGTSSKKGMRGYGLASLVNIVKLFSGTLIAECDYNETYKSHYLNLTLEFKEE